MTIVGGMRLLARGNALAILMAAACAVLTTPPARATDAQVRLLAHGSGDQYWIARVYEDAERGGAFVTDVYSRPAGDADWHQVARVEGRSVDLADRSDQLALLLDGGGWLLVSEETIATGRAAPAGARILAFAPRGDTLLALARVYRPPPASAPTTSASTARTAEDPERLVLYSLAPQGWIDGGEFRVGGPLPATSGDVSLAVVEAAPLAAVREGPRTVAVYRQDGASRGAATVVESEGTLASFKLLGGGPVPVLWTVQTDGRARLHWLAQSGVTTVDVDTGSPGGRPAPAAATYAIERIRVIVGQGLVLLERPFKALAGTPAGEASRVVLPRTPLVPPMFRWVEPLLTVLLLFTIVSSLRRRRELQETMQTAQNLPLAPYGRRFLAGAIDALPLAVSVGLVYFWEKQAEHSGGPLFAARSQVAALAGVLVYLLHTSVTEIAFGRTLGKALLGLRVVGLDGQRPTPGAMLTRNLLRLIDLSMVLFPLVLVLYSPLRQRAGDLAAGTLVVLDKVAPEPATDDAQVEDAVAKEKVPEPVEVGE